MGGAAGNPLIDIRLLGLEGVATLEDEVFVWRLVDSLGLLLLLPVRPAIGGALTPFDAEKGGTGIRLSVLRAGRGFELFLPGVLLPCTA